VVVWPILDDVVGYKLWCDGQVVVRPIMDDIVRVQGVVVGLTWHCVHAAITLSRKNQDLAQAGERGSI